MKQKVFTLLTLALFFCSGAWSTNYYIVCSKAEVPLTAGTTSTTQLLKSNGSTVSATTDISSSLTGTASLFYNSTSAAYSDLTNSSNYNTSSGSTRTIQGVKIENDNTMTITLGSKTFSKMDVFYRCESTNSVSLTIDGTGYATSDKDVHLASITKTFSTSIAIANTSGKAYNVIVILTEQDDTNSPNITKDLRSVYSGNVGTPITLSITAEHAYSYQWYKDDAEIDGATSSSYVYTPTATGSAEFYCVATNSNATGTKTAASTTATVTAEAALHGETISWTTNTSASNEYQNSYSTTYFQNLSVTKGSNVAYETNYDHCLLNGAGDPEELVYVCRLKPSAATNNTLTFAFEVKDGYVFNPSSVSFVGMKQGTNGAVTLDAKWTADGESDIVLGSALALKRASSSGTYATPGGDRFTYNLGELGAASTTSCALVLTLNTTDKAYGIGDIQISGTLTPIESVTMTADYGTFSSTEAINFSDDDDLTIYKVQISGSSAVLSPVDSKLVPANTGVLLKKDGGGAITGKVIGSAPAIADNDFKAATTAKTQADATSGYDIYVLNKEASTYGFFKLSASGTLAAGKAYIEMPESFVGARLSFVFEDEETTAIDAVRSHQTISNNEYFNLAGQRVAQPTKGLYIVNGKKVIIK